MTPPDAAGIIRARRYVSAPAGTYAPPVPVAVEPVSGVAPPAPPADAATVLAPAEQLAAMADPAAAPAAPAGPTSPAPGRRRSRGARIVAMLAGGMFGAALGVAVGAALLALQDAPRWLERISDPRALWQSADDPIVIASVGAVVAGFALIGLLWPLRHR